MARAEYDLAAYLCSSTLLASLSDERLVRPAGSSFRNRMVLGRAYESRRGSGGGGRGAEPPRRI
jgi:hypothetical protein